MLKDEPSPPPRPRQVGRRLPLKELWQALPPESRRKAARVLGKVILRCLNAPPGQEDEHEHR